MEKAAGAAVSEPGAARLLALQPMDLDQARAQHALLLQAQDWVAFSGFALPSFPSLDGLFVYLDEGRGVLDLDALFALRQVLAQVKNAQQALAADMDPEARDKARWPLLLHAFYDAPWPQRVWAGLSRCLSQEGALKDEATPELLSARREIRRIHQQCTRRVKEFVGEQNLSQYLQDEFITISSDRYVLPLKSNFKGRAKGIIHDYSQTGETCYFEPLFLVDLNNELQELKQEEREAEREALRFLTSLVTDEQQAAQAAYEALVDLDVLLAKVAYAAELDARPLEIGPDAPLRLLDARHPVLAASGWNVTPIDVVLSDEQRGLLISGGNAGGKTVCLKTLGLCALMARSGLPVPAAEGSSLPAWDTLFVFLGDEQSLEDHVSTFTAQITHLSKAWDRVDSRTLVILDEFGAGTDPAQGAALAQAVLDELFERGAWLAAATHFPALKAYALAKKELRAACVLFDPQSKKPLYKLGLDQVGASQALDVARDHGLPAEVLSRAESYLLLDGEDAGKTLDRLNELAVARENELEKLRAEKRKLERDRAKQRERFERERDALVRELKAASQDIMRRWKQDKITHKQAMRELAETRKQAVAKGNAPEKRGAARELTFDGLEKGMAVQYLPWSKPGRVEELDPKRNRVKVDLNGVAMWAGLHDVEPGENAGGDQLRKPRAADDPPGKAAGNGGSLSVDLRGLRADAAVSRLAGELDRALLRNVSQVEVVHGRGTGALRKEVHDFLRNFPAVADFGLANEERGGDGMTVVALK